MLFCNSITQGQETFVNTSGSSNVGHININNTLGTHYQDNKRSVCLINIGEGDSPCTGTLLNTVNQDGKRFVISSAHCIPANAKVNDKIDVYLTFNYEAMNPNLRRVRRPASLSYKCASEIRFIDSDLDQVLIEITEDENQLERAYGSVFSNLYYTGWSLDKDSTPEAYISHPFRDIKKVATISESIKLNEFWKSVPIDPDKFNTNDARFDGLITTKINGNSSIILEGGMSGSGILNDSKQLMAINLSGVPGSRFIASLLYNNWYSIEGLSLQKFLDPHLTYVSNVPGGYGLEG